jgi:hypothetical protein
VVELLVANEVVGSSNLLSRSNFTTRGSYSSRSAKSNPVFTEARWQSGHAADCNSVYAGSIPTRASNFSFSILSDLTSNILAESWPVLLIGVTGFS